MRERPWRYKALLHYSKKKSSFPRASGVNDPASAPRNESFSSAEPERYTNTCYDGNNSGWYLTKKKK